jgi:hypothetical protein
MYNRGRSRLMVPCSVVRNSSSRSTPLTSSTSRCLHAPNVRSASSAGHVTPPLVSDSPRSDSSSLSDEWPASVLSLARIPGQRSPSSGRVQDFGPFRTSAGTDGICAPMGMIRSIAVSRQIEHGVIAGISRGAGSDRWAGRCRVTLGSTCHWLVSGRFLARNSFKSLVGGHVDRRSTVGKLDDRCSDTLRRRDHVC